MQSVCLTAVALAMSVSCLSASGVEPWVFVSMPDFLNVDTDYPQPGWETSLGYPWHGPKADLVPLYKSEFRRHLKMPLNGPEHMKGTAFWWKHKNALFVSVDVFDLSSNDRMGCWSTLNLI